MKVLARKSVTQSHGTGCAVACCAYVLGLTYQKALKLFSRPHQAWGRGFYCREIVEALSAVQMKYSYCYLKQKKSHLLSVPGTIVYVVDPNQYPLGHYLVRTPQGDWMNPWSNFPVITPAKSSFQRRLPGEAKYAIFPLNDK